MRSYVARSPLATAATSSRARRSTSSAAGAAAGSSPEAPPVAAKRTPRRARIGRDPERRMVLLLPPTPQPRSADRRELSQVLDERPDRAVEALNLRVRGLDDVVLVGRVRARAVAEAEVSGRELQGLARED